MQTKLLVIFFSFFCSLSVITQNRIKNTRPGYGYTGIPDPNRDDLAPGNAGIYLCNLQSGEKKLIITYKQMQEQPLMADEAANQDRATQKNWFNHLLFNTDGSRFIFLHR